MKTKQKLHPLPALKYFEEYVREIHQIDLIYFTQNPENWLKIESISEKYKFITTNYYWLPIWVFFLKQVLMHDIKEGKLIKGKSIYQLNLIRQRKSDSLRKELVSRQPKATLELHQRNLHV